MKDQGLLVPIKYMLSGKLLRILSAVAAILTAIAIYMVINAPKDYLQGNYAKIMYIHVPAAWLSLSLFVIIAAFSALHLIFKNPVCDTVAHAIAPVGLVHTALALISGAVWGKPTWGTYWVWDARLTSMFLQLCIYLIYLLIRRGNVNRQSAAIASSFFAIFAVINIPVIKFSVYIWNTLHQKNSIITTTGPKIHPEIFLPLIISFFAVFVVTYCAIILKLRRNVRALKSAAKA